MLMPLFLWLGIFFLILSIVCIRQTKIKTKLNLVFSRDSTFLSNYLLCLIFLLFSWLQAKQRASIKWLLSKAYDHRTPEELKEPFYKDHDVSDFKLHKYLPIFVISTQLLMTAAMKSSQEGHIKLQFPMWKWMRFWNI